MLLLFGDQYLLSVVVAVIVDIIIPVVVAIVVDSIDRCLVCGDALLFIDGFVGIVHVVYLFCLYVWLCLLLLPLN